MTSPPAPGGACDDPEVGLGLENTVTSPRAACADRPGVRAWFREHTYLLVLAGFGALALLFFGPAVIPRFSASYVGGSGPDAKLFMWSVAWWPYALGHGLNPLVTHIVWAPGGYNLTWATSIPGPSVLVAPVTLAAGPIAAYNVLALSAPPLAAWTAFLLCRRVTGALAPAVAGGLVFGFSSYELAHLRGQLNLVLVFMVPLLVLLVLRQLAGEISRRRFVALMTVMLVVQFSISTEVTATAVVFGAAALVLAAALGPREQRSGILRVAALVGCSLAIVAVLVSPFLYVAATAPIPAKPISLQSSSSDLLNYVVPTPVTSLGSGTLDPVSSRFTGPLASKAAYLGIPLLAIIALFLWERRRCRVGKFVGLSFGLITLASLGPALKVGGEALFPLPWRVVAWVPLLNKALPGRFVMYGTLSVAVMVAMWLTVPGRIPWARWSLVAVALVSLAPAAPSWWRTVPRHPEFFASGIYRLYLRPGENVLIVSPGAPAEPMLWQAEANMGFALAEGYLGGLPPELRGSSVALALYHGRLPTDPADVQSFLVDRGVRVVIVHKTTEGGWGALDLFGLTPVEVDGVVLYRVPATLGSP